MDDQTISPKQVQRSLKGIDYPATKDKLIEQASTNAADQEVINFLERIPEQDYASPAEVTQQLGEQSKMGMDNDDTM